MQLRNRTIFFILFVVSTVLIVLFTNRFFSQKQILYTIVQILPSRILILYRYELFKKFILLSGFFIFNLIVLLYFLYWLIIQFTKKKRTIFRYKIILTTLIFIVLLISATLSYRWILSKIFFASGYKNYQIRKDQVAAHFYEESIKLDPKFSKACLALMNIYKNNNKPQKAIMIGREFIKYGKDHNVLEMLGDLSSSLGNYRESIHYYEQVSELMNCQEINYKLANIYYKLSKFQHCINVCTEYPGNDQFLLLQAKSLLGQNQYDDALKAIRIAISINSSDPEIWFIQGVILSILDKKQKAIESLQHAMWLKKEYPDVYIELAQLFIKDIQFVASIECLRKAIYYDNKRSDSYVQLKLLERGNIRLREKITKNEKITLSLDTSELEIEKDQSFDITLNFQVPNDLHDVRVRCLEPYGWGVSCTQINIQPLTTNQVNVQYRVTGRRDSEVNLGNPWKLNFVVYDEKSGQYNNKILSICVNDPDEGSILFVITEDFECTEGSHIIDSTPNRNDLSVEETEIDLIKKGSLADSIANAHGIRWSHIADLGSAFLRLDWLAEMSQDSGWQRIWHEIKEYYHRSVDSGNDVQLHIHAYNIPGSQNFYQHYDKESNQLVLDSKGYARPKKNGDGHFGAWANIYSDLGYFNDINSKMGSIFRGIKLYENLLREKNPEYRTLFFRAGEWEFGESREEMCESIIALRKNKILAGSDAYQGKFGKRNFIFNKRIGDNAYFCAFENSRKPAQSLLDIGILQILPIPNLHHFSHVRPIDDPFSVKKTYDICFKKNGKIKPGVHILTEMYHINRINFGDKNWDSLNSHYRDWKRLSSHFREISNSADKAKFVTISQAVIDYLDYYSPDIIALRVNERKIDNKTYMYDIKFIGKDLLIDKTHRHYVSVKPPSYMVNSIKEIVLFHNRKKIKSWKNITTYEDLEFITIARYGYKLRVKVNF